MELLSKKKEEAELDEISPEIKVKLDELAERGNQFEARYINEKGFIMDELKVLNDNFKAEDNSFLYCLHEENYFHETMFAELCDCISLLCRTRPHDKGVSAQICFIYGQVLRHIIYHFDPDDLSRIANLPDNYNKELETLEHTITEYFSS